MTQPVIVEEYRGGSLENTHQGIICVIDEKREVVYEKGDIGQSVFYRSAMKPLQAIPVFSAGIVEKYDLTLEEAALFTASQRGEAYHEAALESLRGKLGIEESCLVCGSSIPLNDEPKAKYLWDHKAERKLMHNCAGKHLGLLAYARECGFSLEGYEHIDHPVQQEILHHVANLSETPVDEIRSGMDGCGVAVHSIPLKNMAISYLKFAVPELIEDRSLAGTVVKIGEAMNAHPEIVASHDFICTALLEDPNIVAKGGAQGVYCLAFRKEKMSVALKVLSGSELVWPTLVARILEKLDYENKETIERLHALGADKILNDDGIVIGERKVLL